MALAAAAAAGRGQAAGDRLNVVTSFLPVYCFAANVAGNYAKVENLLPPGTEPHDFQFSAREVKRLEAADVVIINGLGIESWLDKVIRGRGEVKAEVVELSAGLKRDLIYSLPYLDLGNRGAADAQSGRANPHVWLDPRLAEHGVTNILLALQRADPAHAEGYRQNAAKYVARLEKLDAELEAGLAPFKGQPIITFHDAYPYFARRYGLKIVGVIEEVPDVQPSPRYLERLHEVILRKGVKVIFSDKQFSAKLAEQIGRDYHVAVAQLDTLETGELKPDAYEAGMRSNLRVLEGALK